MYFAKTTQSKPNAIWEIDCGLFGLWFRSKKEKHEGPIVIGGKDFNAAGMITDATKGKHVKMM